MHQLCGFTCQFLNYQPLCWFMQLKEFTLNISSSLLEIVTDLSTLRHPWLFLVYIASVFPTLVKHYLRFRHFGTNFMHQEKGVLCYTRSLSS